MTIGLGLAVLFLLAIFVVPALALHALLSSHTERTAIRPVGLLTAFVGVAAAMSLLLLIMTRIGLVGFFWSWLLAALALAVAAGLGFSAHRRDKTVFANWELRPLLAVSAALVVVALPAWVAVLGRLDTIGRISGWFYWGAVQDVVAANGFPSTTNEWGIVTEFFNFHLVFSALGAATAEASGAAESLASVQAIRLAASFAMPAAAYLAVRAWGAGRLAGVTAAFLVTATWVVATKPVGYVPEGIGYILAVSLIGLVYPALVGRDRLAQVALVGGMAALTQLHGIAGTFTYLVVLGALAAFVLVPSEDSLAMRLRLAFTIGLAALVGALAVGTILGERASSASILEDAASLTADGRDPTWDFVVLATTRRTIDDDEKAMVPPTIVELLADSPTRGFLRTPRALSWLVFAGIAVLGLWAARGSSVSQRGRFVFFAMLLGIGFVVGGGILLALPYETYVPRRTGVLRLAQLWIIIPALFAAMFTHLLRRTWVAAAGLGVALLLWGVAAGGVVADGNVATRDQIAELAALPVEPGSRVLTNAWTQGFIRGTTPTTGLLDGQAPYLNPELLPRSLKMLEDVRAFYFRPAPNAFVLDTYDADFVLVGHDRNSFGGTARFTAATEKLKRLAELTLVQSTDLYTLFQVSNVDSP